MAFLPWFTRDDKAALSIGAGAADAVLVGVGEVLTLWTGVLDLTAEAELFVVGRAVVVVVCTGADVAGLVLAIVLVSYFLAGTEANFQFLQLALFDDTVTEGVWGLLFSIKEFFFTSFVT